MIDIDKVCENLFVWKMEDVEKLWKELRIFGKLVGSFPRRPYQNQCLSLPLQLLPVEAKLLIDKGYAKLVEMNPLNEEEAKSNMREYNKFKKDSFDEQRRVFREERIKQIEEMADKIIEGKMKKLAKLKKDNSTNSEEQALKDKEDTELRREAIIEEEIRKISPASDGICIVQIFTGCPWTNVDKECAWSYPETSKEKLHYAVFSDLWEKGYYLTNGSKFGGDFLAYAGNPFLYHALFIVVCTEYTQQIPVKHIPLYGHLGTRVRKTVVLATLKPCGSVGYISLKWCGKWYESSDSDSDSESDST